VNFKSLKHSSAIIVFCKTVTEITAEEVTKNQKFSADLQVKDPSVYHKLHSVIEMLPFILKICIS